MLWLTFLSDQPLNQWKVSVSTHYKLFFSGTMETPCRDRIIQDFKSGFKQTQGFFHKALTWGEGRGCIVYMLILHHLRCYPVHKSKGLLFSFTIAYAACCQCPGTWRTSNTFLINWWPCDFWGFDLNHYPSPALFIPCLNPDLSQ